MYGESGSELLIQAEAAYRRAIADPAAGRRRAESIAADARVAGDAVALAVALRAAGWAARELYDHAGARSLLDEAVDVARSANLGDRQAEALITRSAMFLELGRTRSARRDIVAARTAAGRRTRAEVEYAEALLEDKAGNFTAAAEAYGRVIGLVDGDRPDLRFKALNNLGMTQLRIGRVERAERTLIAAAELAATFSPAYEAHATESLATVATQLGDPVEALRRYERAESLFAAAGMPLVDLHRNKASTLLALRMLDEALQSAARAVELVEHDLDGPLMLAESLLSYADIALAMERYEDCLKAAGQAERLLRQQGRPGWRSRAALLIAQAEAAVGPADDALMERVGRVRRRMAGLGMPAAIDAALLEGRLAAARGRRRKAIAAWHRAAGLARGRPVLRRLQGTYARARAAELDDDRRRVSQLCRHGLVELAQYRATFASHELRARAASYGTALADLGTRAAVRSGRAERIWAWLERGRGVVFGGTTDLPPDERLRPLLAELRATERALLEAEPGTADPALTRRLTSLERQLRHAAWQVDQRSAEWVLPTTRTLAGIRAQLADRVLLQYGVLDSRVIGVAASSARVAFVDLGPVDVVIGARRRLAFALRRLGRPRSSSSADASRAALEADVAGLTNMLVSPFVDTIGDADEIVVSPPSPLVGLPWAEFGPLSRVPVRVTPSAVAWQLTAQRTPTSDRVVGVAGPGLPGADADVQALQAIHGARTEILAGREATCEAVRTAVAGAGVVHVACHGRLRADSPTFSSLTLADGPLTVHDLERLPAPAHQWVLASCDLGTPGDLLGQELEGVLAALLYGGAAGVVAATVSVPDRETSVFMTDLHQHLAAGASLAEATATARASRDPSKPAELVVRTAFSCYGGG